MKSGSKSRVLGHVRLIILGFGSDLGYNFWVIPIRLPSGFQVFLGFVSMNLLNVGFRVGFRLSQV